VGLLAAAILVVNNIRDADTDRRAGKRTLAVRLGRERARKLWLAMVLIALAAPLVVAAAGGLSWWLALTVLSWGLVPPLWNKVRGPADGPTLNAALADTGRLLAIYSVLLATSVLIS
jgi:1,4-dihydroxy-2-naphthoate octaprenyltransferase